MACTDYFCHSGEPHFMQDGYVNHLPIFVTSIGTILLVLIFLYIHFLWVFFPFYFCDLLHSLWVQYCKSNEFLNVFCTLPI